MRSDRFLVSGSCVALLVFAFVQSAAAATSERVVTPFDSGWRFLKSDASGAQAAEFDDTAWRALSVPHDWSIEGPVAQSNPSGGSGGNFPDGVGWYRKTFDLSSDDAQKHIFVDFDSLMANSDVWINGFLLGHRPYGYVSIRYELTGHLNFGAGKSNVLAVRLDQSQQPASRYYMGAGILGHVRLVATDPVHLEHWSVFVTTPEVTADHAVISVKSSVVNQSDAPRSVSTRVTLLGPDGQPVAYTGEAAAAQTVDAGKSADFTQSLHITNPGLWDLDNPRLYHAAVVVMDGQTALDDETAQFGIRTIEFKPATGFWLNGKNVRIQGVCLHAENSAFGSAVPAGSWEHRLAALRELGINAIRDAHNPPSPQFLDTCDRMGFLVMDEMFDCWDVAKSKYDYHLYFDKWSLTDLRDTVQRDRNHPSIILWSAGNEIHDTPNATASLRILSGLVKEFHANDPTRPVTQALFRPNTSHDYDDGLADLLDVVGTNYRMSELVAAQQAKPTRTLVGTENHLTDVEFMASHPELSGIFIWAGVDYLGESRWPSISGSGDLFDRTDLPHTAAYQTAIYWDSKPFVHMVRTGGAGRGGRAGRGGGGAAPDAAGAAANANGAANPNAPGPIDGDVPDPNGPPDVAGAGGAPGAVANGALPGAGRGFAGFAGRGGRGGAGTDWTPANLGPHQESVTVYTNCPKVDLLLNGSAVTANAARAATPGTYTFNVPFAPGTIKAVGYDSAGTAVATEELHTAGKAAKIVLSTDEKTVADDWDGVSFIRATVTDADGIPVPTASNEIKFDVSGAGVLAAVDSADGINHELFQSSQRQAYQGICFAMVKANAPAGQISVTATAPGLADGAITVEAAPARP